MRHVAIAGTSVVVSAVVVIAEETETIVGIQAHNVWRGGEIMSRSGTRGCKGLPAAPSRAILSFGLLVLATLWLPGAPGEASAERATARVLANRTVPAVTPPLDALAFTENPDDSEFLRSGVSAEPLVPAWHTRSAENRDLATALLAYDARRRAGTLDAVESLVSFLSAHPETPWRPSLLVSLGTVYRRTGHFSKALEAWQSAWDAGRELDGSGHAVGDSALAKLSQFEAYLGRKELLAPLLESIRDRPLHGAAAELVTESRHGLADMLDRPRSSFRCGPLALERVLISQSAQPAKASLGPLEAARSTPNGLSLSSVAALSDKAGMRYQMAFRTPGAEIITPAVVHWKVDHYAAIVGRTDTRFQVEDATFGESIRITEETLDEEASGYFLVPRGRLPPGWRAVNAVEGDKVWGRGNTGSNKDNGATGPGAPALKPPTCTGCTSWNVELSVVGLSLHDTPLGYTPPVGPAVRFEMYYSHRDTQQPQTFSYTNLGPKWTTTWLSYVTDSGNGSVDLYARGGGDEPYTFPTTGEVTTSNPGPFTQAVLTRVLDGDGNTKRFTRQLKDGSVETFAQAMGGQYFMTAVADPEGNAVTIRYDKKMRIVALVDAMGQVTTLEYGLAKDPLKLTKVEDPFGRTATFSYTANESHLASITDTLGITSSYVYGDGDLVSTLKTPYGTTKFAAGDNLTLNYQRYLMITDTLGRVSRVEFQQAPAGFPDSDPDATVPTGVSTTNGLNQYRNTYIWDARQYGLALTGSGLDYTRARVVHWLHTLDDSTARVPESTKQPLENRVWYDFPGQTSSIYVGSSNTPLHAGRVLDDGTTQLWTYEYNSHGKVTQATDPVGRIFHYTYDGNGIDLLTVSNTTSGRHDVLATLTYNDKHEPLTVMGANGATTQYGYNSVGQLVKKTDADGSVTTYVYNTNHDLTSLEGPLGAKYALTYDDFGRVGTATDPAGETVKYEYDAADRPTRAAFPDGTAATFGYALLDLTRSTDRLGRTTVVDFDSERETVRVVDPLGQTVALGYNPGGGLVSIADGNGNETQFVRDAQERIVAKQYTDGTRARLAYEQSTSRVQSETDALGQTVSYTYDSDDALAAVSYKNARTPTADVSLTYDPAYPRPIEAKDGTGTTKYEYNPVSKPPSLGANLLRSVTIPVAGAASVKDTVSYTYDALNRPAKQTVNGAVETWGYDALSRVTSDKNALDSFAYGYADGTDRVARVTSARGPQATFAYFGADGDELVKELTLKTRSGALLSDFAYTYDADDNVTTFTQRYLGQAFASAVGEGGAALGMLPAVLEGPKRGGGAGNVGSSRLADAFSIAAGLLLAAWGWPRRSKSVRRARSVVAPALLALLFMGCGDHGGGTPSAQVTTFTYDGASRLISAFVGTDVSTPSEPQFAYGYDSASNLTHMTAANGSEKKFAYTATNTIASGAYDANGSPKTLDGSTYTWDAANRIVMAKTGGSESEFTYDGLSRLVRIVTRQGDSVVSDRSYTWCGSSRCLEHDNLKNGSPVSKRYFDQGVQIGAQAYYYVTDRLGSVRQLVDSSGAVRAQYDYDPYGALTKIGGDLDSDVGFTGSVWNGSSGLSFATYRAYDASNARWLNRDPSGEASGVNLYSYVSENPATLRDPAGLWGVGVGVGGNISVDRSSVALLNPLANFLPPFSYGGEAGFGWFFDFTGHRTSVYETSGHGTDVTGSSVGVSLPQFSYAGDSNSFWNSGGDAGVNLPFGSASLNSTTSILGFSHINGVSISGGPLSIGRGADYHNYETNTVNCGGWSGWGKHHVGWGAPALLAMPSLAIEVPSLLGDWF
jgi:RHS repeat-associated protein